MKEKIRLGFSGYPERLHLKVRDGTVIVAGDSHYRPGPPTVMHRALLHFLKLEKPVAFVFNGDIIDAPTVSRHLPLGWEDRPLLADEIEAAGVRMAEMAGYLRNAKKLWNLGNHDTRFETRLAHLAPEYARIHGFHLADHFPEWQIATSTWINNDVVIKHRYKGGDHAPYNNTLKAGRTIVAGHLHSAKVIPVTDYNGTRYGVDTGCLADTDSPSFRYNEDNPLNWRSAFVILTFRNGKLLQPELVLKWDKKSVQFRGRLIKV